MFQTNQGPSAPAHQFLFAGTSAPSAADDASAVFVSENNGAFGCLSQLNSTYFMIDPARAPRHFEGVNNPQGTFCFSHDTMASLLEQYQYRWRYYTIGFKQTDISNSIWTAPNWIREICQPNTTFTACTGTEWVDNVDLDPADVLRDVQNCKLVDMVWVIPKGQNSDHPSDTPKKSNDGGPAWVANVVNAVSNSSCIDHVNGASLPYWKDTAIVVTWDDWGGFYDHVLPPFLSPPNQGQGDYQLGFRVPLIFISAYTRPIIDNTNQYDFGSILRFAESKLRDAARSAGICRPAIDYRSPGFLRLSTAAKEISDSDHCSCVILPERYAAPRTAGHGLIGPALRWPGAERSADGNSRRFNNPGRIGVATSPFQSKPSTPGRKSAPC
jgi:phospholipase C